MSNKILLYFGVWDVPGHYLHYQGGRTVREENSGIPNVNPSLLRHLDGTFPPPERDGLSLYNESIVPPVRIVAWWDRSGDKRPGSSSTLVGYGYDSAEEMIDEAYKLFPKQMNRQKRPTLYKPA